MPPCHKEISPESFTLVTRMTQHTGLNEALPNRRGPGRTVMSHLQKDGAAAAAAKSLQSCSTLHDPIDSSPPGFPVPGILQARTPEWVAISFSNAWKWKVKVKSLSCVWLLATPRTAAHQAPPSMGFSRQEYWSGVPLPTSYISVVRMITQLLHRMKYYQ